MLPVRRLSVPAYDELVLVTRPSFASRNPQLLRDFIAAVARGTAASVRNPRAAVRAVEQNAERDPSLGRDAIEAQVRATLPLLSGSLRIRPGRTAHLVRWMREQGLIHGELEVSELVTNTASS